MKERRAQMHSRGYPAISMGVENAGMADSELEEKPAVLTGMTGAAVTGE